MGLLMRLLKLWGIMLGGMVGGLCVQNDTNMGVAHSLNVGIGYCLTHKPADFMARIDAGDVMVPQRLKTQVALMQSNPDIDVCGSNMIVVALDGSRRVTRLPETDVDIRTSIPFLNPMAHPTVMMRMNIFDAFAYNGMFYASEDYALWAQLAGREAAWVFVFLFDEDFTTIFVVSS